jgi:hypothetical protein
MDELLLEFQAESKQLVADLLSTLESLEGDYSKYRELEKYGQVVDRIMGAAKSLAMAESTYAKRLDSIGKYSELCKAVAYKSSQVGDNEGLFTAVVACLFDATEMLEKMVAHLAEEEPNLNQVLSAKFVDRLKWISQRLPAHLRSTVSSASSEGGQSIEEMLKALGLKV